MGKRNNFEDREIMMSATDFKKLSVRSFVIYFALIGVAITGLIFLFKQDESENGQKPMLRKALVTNERLSSMFFSAGRSTKPYKLSDVDKKARVNGDDGMTENFDPATWKLHVARNPGDTLIIIIDDIKALPKTEVIFDFKCVEGWDQVTYWGGVRFADFMAHYHLAPQQAMKYVGMSTPDSEYYVGIDMPSLLQPQTILCYELNGKPLPKNQGAPLRLIIPVKYGIKHIKRIGFMSFSNEKPKDFWYERGYDYYAGL